MRQVLIALVLLPFAAHAQASSAQTAQAPTDIMTLIASNVEVNPFAAPPRATSSDNATGLVQTHQVISTTLDGSLSDPMKEDLASTTAFGAPEVTSAPQLIEWRAIEVPQSELALSPAASTVSIHAIIDRDGVPHELRIEHSAGAAVDQSALAAVSHFRFAPATVAHVPVEAGVVIHVTIDKQ